MESSSTVQERDKVRPTKDYTYYNKNITKQIKDNKWNEIKAKYRNKEVFNICEHWGTFVRKITRILAMYVREGWGLNKHNIFTAYSYSI